MLSTPLPVNSGGALMHALTLLFFVTYLIILRPADGASLRLAEELAEASSRVAPVRARALKNLGTPCAARICRDLA